MNDALFGYDFTKSQKVPPINMQKKLYNLHSSPINDIEFSPTENNILVTCSDDKSIKAFNTKKSDTKNFEKNPYKLFDKCHNDGIFQITFSQNGRYFASAAMDKSINIISTDDNWSIIHSFCNLVEHSCFSLGLSYNGNL